MSENNDTSESNSLGSDSILQASTRGVNPVLRSGMLRPSLLSSALSKSGAVGADAAEGVEEKVEVVPSNPFLKEQKDVDEVCEEIAQKGEKDNVASGKTADEDDEAEERPDPLTMLRKNGLERSNLFAAAKNSIPRVEKSGFVFGQNVHERVLGENIHHDASSKSENSDAGSTSGELLFSSVIQNAAKANEADGAVAKETDSKSLNDVAREYEESRAQKRKYEEVETFTGEENEMNIVDVNCKLFAFENSNWEERGRGSLRLNDAKKENECSRVVFRTSGNLRLLLNTKVWAGMVAERPSQKSLRLTAIDNTGKIKIFLVMARPVEINQLHKALVARIDSRKATHPEECAATSENNGVESNNGIVLNDNDEVANAASVAEPEPDESSPKKSLLAETQN